MKRKKIEKKANEKKERKRKKKRISVKLAPHFPKSEILLTVLLAPAIFQFLLDYINFR